MAATGAASAGRAATGTAATGAVAGIITMVMTSFSSAISVFRGGGAHILGAGATRTDIIIIPIPMATEDTGTVTMAMVMGRPAMIMDMATRMGVTLAAITAARTTEIARLQFAIAAPRQPALLCSAILSSACAARRCSRADCMCG